jgi:hypothetical protein
MHHKLAAFTPSYSLAVHLSSINSYSLLLQCYCKIGGCDSAPVLTSCYLAVHSPRSLVSRTMAPMNLVQKSFDYLSSSGSVVLDVLYQRQLSQYWPLESRGNLYIPTTNDGNTPPRKRSKFRIASWTALLLLALLVLYYSTRRLIPPETPPGDLYDPGVMYGETGPRHPILKLVEDAEFEFKSTTAGQSTSLAEAIAEYRRRYGMPPPPLFDKWYKYAVDSEVRLIDEYDSIHESLLLFWSLDPAEIRRRALEALGYSQSLMGVSIRNGKVRTVGDGQDDWQEPATKEMISQFSEWLPDMDLVFNVNDESRVLAPHEDVERMHNVATGAVRAVRASSNAFSAPKDLNDGQSYDQVSETRFNRLDHQQTWSHSRMSCPIDTPARHFQGDIEDEKTGFVYGGLEFVFNVTAFSDICLVPSVRHSIGLFNHPNVYSVSHDLVPVFSPSKLSTFHDILYPSPYYYADRTVFDSSFAVPWSEKDSELYWRGATSGGYSQGGTWRTLLRQSVLAKLMNPGTVNLLERKDDVVGDHAWKPKEVSGGAIQDRYDAKFTEIKQCDVRDCAEMRNFFGNHPNAPQADAWKHKYLLDMDGNALSGRFYALMKSASLPMKVAYYREWHIKRLFPWKHYVPVSASTEEYAEILRYFEDEEDGRKIAERIAMQGSDWAQKVVRRKDMEIYMFRLLLE